MSLNVQPSDHKKKAQRNLEIGSVPPADMQSVFTPGEMTPGPQFPSVDPSDHDSEYSMYYRASPRAGGGPAGVEDQQLPQDLGRFTLILIVAQLLGLLAIVLCAMWTGYYLGGFSWSADPGKAFNYHPLLAVIALIVLQGDASLVYRALREGDKKVLKAIHGVLHLTIFVLAAIMLRAAFKFHNANHITNMYSLHSWLGMGTVVMFGIQYLLGLGHFVLPIADADQRKAYVKIHKLVGLVTFSLSVVTSLIGIQQKLFIEMLSLDNNSTAPKYSDFSAEGIVANSLGLSVTFFACCILFLLLNPAYQRLPLPEENSIQLRPE